jgi:hypothetical protein
MKRVISGILAMLLVLPALEITSGINGATTSLPLAGMEMLHMQALTGGDNTTAFIASLKVGAHVLEGRGVGWYRTLCQCTVTDLTASGCLGIATGWWWALCQ